MQLKKELFFYLKLLILFIPEQEEHSRVVDWPPSPRLCMGFRQSAESEVRCDFPPQTQLSVLSQHSREGTPDSLTKINDYFSCVKECCESLIVFN